MEMTRDIAWAAATDAGNAHAREHGRTAWNKDDYNAAVTRFNELWREEWDALRDWLEGRGADWTVWAYMGSIASDIADDVLADFDIEPTASARARLRREVDAAIDKIAVMREP